MVVAAIMESPALTGTVSPSTVNGYLWIASMFPNFALAKGN